MRLFDTAFVIDLVNSNRGAVALAKTVDGEASLAAVSAVTVQEYLFGVHFRYQAEPGSLEQKLASARNDLDRFEVIPLSRQIAELSSRIQAELVGSGSQIGINGVYIAATALRYGLSLVTRDEAHFRRIRGLKVEAY
jgi:tRNA(fMet)-specific endonuclease VapC